MKERKKKKKNVYAYSCDENSDQYCCSNHVKEHDKNDVTDIHITSICLCYSIFVRFHSYVHIYAIQGTLGQRIA